jgi:hypothetical protein
MKDLKITVTIPGDRLQDIIQYAQADGKSLSYKLVAATYKEYFETEDWQCQLEDVDQFVKDALELE